LVFKEKLGPDGDVDTHQIRVVAGGHKQVYGVDYNEMFATAAKMPSVRVVLANGAQQDWEMHQVDVKSAYLNAPLEDDIYMIPLKGVLKPGQEGKVCKFLKALYGLKHAGQEWQKTLSAVFVEDLGFQRSGINHSVLFRRTKEEHTIVAVVTDDMAITSKRASDVMKFKLELRKHFDIVDGGEL
jgi:hypothetical protein